ncbi:MAG: hypothetical protein M1832_000332 [Thelocarpon impressellum]|nr:MAG: hypothetical protein M1832_000332 [Thelocarpon impressellum]
MSGDLEPPDIRSDGDAVGSTSTLRSLSPAAGPGRRMSRSPHPYHRRGPRLTDADGSIPGGDLEETQYLPSPSPTPSPYDTELDGAAHEAADDTRRLKAARSSSDSGTEADDEGLSFLKGLPAPPTKPRKGLRDERGMEASGGPSPLLTPAYLSDSGRRYSAELRHHPTDATGVETLGGTEARKKVESLRKRRRSEKSS